MPPMLPAVQGHCFHRGAPTSLPALHSDTLSPLGCVDSGKQGEGSKGSGARAQNGRFQKLLLLLFIIIHVVFSRVKAAGAQGNKSHD